MIRTKNLAMLGMSGLLLSAAPALAQSDDRDAALGAATVPVAVCVGARTVGHQRHKDELSQRRDHEGGDRRRRLLDRLREPEDAPLPLEGHDPLHVVCSAASA